jgi:UDP-glucuronate decarboxylase
VSYPNTYPADEPQRRCPDIGKAAADVGYRPVVELREGLRRFMTWAQRTYAAGQRTRRPARPGKRIATAAS